MGTRFDLLFVGKNRNRALEIWEHLSSTLKQLHALFNRFDERSEIFYVNHNAFRREINVSDHVWKILSLCQLYFESTNGLFDVTLSDFSQVALNQSNRSVLFITSDVQIDLGGIAKGYAMEEIRKVLFHHDVQDAFVDFGDSSVLAMGKHPHGNSWLLTVQNPYDRNIALEVMELSNKNISTSGNMPNHSMHIKNTRNGENNNEKKMVTVVSDDAVEAEVLSSTLMIAEHEELDRIVKRFNIDKYRIYYL